jgi:hypothetical protein
MRESSGIVVIIVDLLKITVEHQRMGEQLLLFLVLFLFQKTFFLPIFYGTTLLRL